MGGFTILHYAVIGELVSLILWLGRGTRQLGRATPWVTAAELLSYWATSCWATELLSYWATELLSYWAAELLSCWAAELLSYWATELLSYRATEPPSCLAAELQSYWPTSCWANRANWAADLLYWYWATELQPCVGVKRAELWHTCQYLDQSCLIWIIRSGDRVGLMMLQIINGKPNKRF